MEVLTANYEPSGESLDFAKDKIMVVEADQSSRTRLVSMLAEAGYEVSAPDTAPEDLRSVLAFRPALLLLSGEPAELDCCVLLSELKASPAASWTRVIMLTSGGSDARTRALDLGADDVVSRFWHPAELLARVREQLRIKREQEEAQERARIAEAARQSVQTAVDALTVGKPMSQYAFSFGRPMKSAGAAALLVAAVIMGSSFFLYRRTARETSRTYSAVAELARGLASEQDVIKRARNVREELEHPATAPLEAQRRKLVMKSEQSRIRMVAAQAQELAVLRRQLGDTDAQLRQLEKEEKSAQTVIRSYARSVCLLQVVIAFRDRATGLRLRYAGVDAQGLPSRGPDGNVLVTEAGPGPEIRLDVFGTGFLATGDGRILTNRHVVEPLWQNDELSTLVEQGVDPVVTEMNAYFPDIPHGLSVVIKRISSRTDLAVVQGDLRRLHLKPILLDTRKNAVVSGQPVVLLGYPTGLDAILARAGEQTTRAIAVSSKGDPTQVMDELARRNLIRSLSTQGHIGDVLPDKIVYDAQTTFGGSGGPLFNSEGKVIGVNYATVRGFAGSNFAIPIRYTAPLLVP